MNNFEITPINNADLEKNSDQFIINLCPLPMVCDGETCQGGWCHGVCFGV